LAQFLRREIASHGPISFARFMEATLYHPEWGYYEQPAMNPGRAGDYFTNVSVGPLFGELLGFRLARWLSTLPEGPLHLVEGGAHDGRLAADVLGFLAAHEPVLANRIEYWLLEPSAKRQARQAELLRGLAGRVRWARGWEELPRSRGVVFGNELLDALPVHRLVWQKAEGAWSEAGVGCAGDEFVWTRLPGDAARLAPVLPAELVAVLPDGFAIEVGNAAVQWWRRAAAALDRGWLLTFDYGDAPGERLQPARIAGTLRAYRDHRASAEVLAEPGAQDLTAHVDFGAVMSAGEAAGLRTEGLWRQEQFLGGIVREIEAGGGGFPDWTPARLRQCRTLLHPAHLGSSFKVLLQSRGVG
jgi:SAM-dependent MidA family methyltransferase